MKIQFKTLKPEVFYIEIDDAATVGELRQKIADERPDFPLDQSRLIYAGKILDSDEKKVEEYNINAKDKAFVVIMTIKPKVTASETTATSSVVTTTTRTEAQSMAQSTAGTTSTDASTTAATTTTATESNTSSSPSETMSTQSVTESAQSTALTSSSAFQKNVDDIVNMGFPREQVMQALQRSFNNPDRAVEYLIQGFPPELEPEVDADLENTTTPATTDSAATGLAFLRNLPQFDELRRQVQTNPQALPLLLQQLGTANPDLFQTISQNQEEFIQLLNERTGTEGSEPAAGGAAPLGEGMGAPAGGAAEAIQIQVTMEEKEAIEQIRNVFPCSEAEALQAYRACDRNVESAANFLWNEQDFD